MHTGHHYPLAPPANVVDAMWRTLGFHTYPTSSPFVNQIKVKTPEDIEELLDKGKCCDLLVYLNCPRTTSMQPSTTPTHGPIKDHPGSMWVHPSTRFASKVLPRCWYIFAQEQMSPIQSQRSACYTWLQEKYGTSGNSLSIGHAYISRICAQ